ncbi:MAG: heavy-metal-associated domain-containing protein [Saprospiraceae bacterium]
MKTQEIFVENIKCGGCANSIKKGLEKLDSTTSVEVDIEEGKVVLLSESTINTDKYVAALHGMGYPIHGEGNLIKTAQSYVSCMIGRMS